MPSAELVNFLQEKFAGIVKNVTVPREKRVFAETSVDKLVEVVRTLKEWGLGHLGTITGLDSGAQFEIIYHLSDDQGLVFNLKVFIPRDAPQLPSVTDIFQGVFLYERELMDLFGIEVIGAPPGRRYPLPDNWPAGQFPLRKDWQGLPPQVDLPLPTAPPSPSPPLPVPPLLGEGVREGWERGGEVGGERKPYTSGGETR